MSVTTKNVSRVGAQPVRMMTAAAAAVVTAEVLNNEEEGVRCGWVGGDKPPPLQVSLSSCPQTPYDLWLGVDYGIRGSEAS